MSKVYVLGGAQTDFERNWTKEGKNVIALLREVITDGLNNIGLTFEDVDKLNKENKIACFVGNFIGELYIDQGHLGALLTKVHPAFHGIPSGRYEAACASGSVALDSAITKIKAEDYELVFVVGFELMKTVNSKVCGDYLGRAAYYETEGKNIEFPFPKLFGQLANETVKKYSLDKERYLKNLAKISSINYQNAKRNPNAQTRKWFMNIEHANLRDVEYNNNIGGMIAISDCSQVTDGAAFVALCSESYKKDNYENKELPIVKGYGHTVAPMEFSDKIDYAKNYDSILPLTKRAVDLAYQRSNLTVEDIDVFETHDCFSSSEYVAISAFGLTKPGFEYEAIESGLIDFNGLKPINPSGGLIGCGHPVGSSGVRMFLDLFKQVTQSAGSYQVLHNVKNGLMLNIGGSATTNYVYIVGIE